jgi:cell division transport system permease protein
VVFNTIRIAIYSNREEIGVLRLVGASNGFINGPYVVSGAIYGAIAALATMVLTVPAVLFAAPYVSVFIPSMDLAQYLTANLFNLLVYQLFFGVGLGVVSSAIAIRRYLKI